MRPRFLSLVLILVVCLLARPAHAATQCALTATPLLVASEGLTEPVGDILLSCYGGAPLGHIQGALQISLSQKIGNAIDDSGYMQGITFSIQTPVGYTNLPIVVRPLDTSILIDGFQFNMTAQGTFLAKVSGLRAQASSNTRAYLQFLTNEQLPIPSPIITVATSQTGLYGTTLAAAVYGTGPAIPDYLDYDNMMASGAALSTTRVTEGFGSAFVRRSTADTTNGMRIVVTYSGVPAEARMFAPDAIAGSSAATPTTSGQFGANPTGGLYNPLGGNSLLLVRVRGAQADGSGGFVIWSPSSGPQTLFGVGEIDYQGPTPYLVYEVVDTNPAILESAQIPLWLFLPTDQYIDGGIITQTLSLGPLSSVAGSVAGAPIPRYKASIVTNDCKLVGDCEAYYYPKMEITPTRTPEDFSAPSGASAQSGYVLVHNIGGGLLQWRVLPRYLTGQGWISVTPANGANNATVRFDVLPKNLPEGDYEADLAFQHVNPYSGDTSEQLVHVKLTVTAPLPEQPPPPAPPIVSNVVTPSERYSIQFAPGSLIVVEGSNFDAQTTVNINDHPATIVSSSATELTLQVPVDLPPGSARVIAYNSGVASVPYTIDLIPVSPDLLYVENEDNGMNTAGQPADTGRIMQIFLTGINGAITPVNVNLHDRWFFVTPETTDQPGVSKVTISIPEDLPTMQTEAKVCAQFVATDGGVCSYPRAVWLRAPAQ